jgi:putative ATPase
MTDLFSPFDADQPRRLADLLRPTRLDDIVGQTHVLRPGSPLRNRVAAGNLGAVVLFGAPGIGKTTIARALGATMKKAFRPLHATQATIADVKRVAEEARTQPTLLFLDEIHRFSATQQESLLAFLEEARFDFVAATTGNPFHDLTKGIISRCALIKLEPLELADIATLIERAVAYIATTQRIAVAIAPEVRDQIAAGAGGDARRALNLIEGATVGVAAGTTVTIWTEDVIEGYAGAPTVYDRQGDAHYDIISAFIKSMRGSDPDATLYWLGRMLTAGEDPRYIARRLVVHASEDVGLADNSALQTAIAAQIAVDTIGMPEARINLAHAALHIARAPKSNSACRGIGAALSFIETQPPIPVPLYLRDAHYAGAKALGHVGYVSPHSTPEGWREETYAPGLERGALYQSDARDAATFEKRADAYWQNVTGKPPFLHKKPTHSDK